MITPPNIDPFNLVSLSEDINERCLRILASDFPAVVSEASLNTLKEKFRDEIFALFTEMLNDWQCLREKDNLSNLLGKDWVIPTVEMMVQKFPSIYQQPPSDELANGNQANIQWHAAQVEWTVNAWMQVWGHLTKQVQTKSVEDGKVDKKRDDEELLIDIPRPSEILVITRLWQKIRVLTFEYLQKKARLLEAIGEESVQIDIANERRSLINEANQAFWEHKSDAHILLLQAFRETLIQTLRLNKEVAALPGQLSTSNLLGIAYMSGLEFPFEAQVIGNIVFDLERFQDNCEEPEVSYLYPAFRILDRVIRELSEMPFNEDAHKQVCAILNQAIE